MDSAGKTKSDANGFGAQLRNARIAAALSQEELAERAGLSTRGVSDLERGIHPYPRLETVRMLAAALALDDSRRIGLLAAARPTTNLAPRRAKLNSLPLPPTRLIGREREMADIGRLLRDDGVRLLTLTGAGGSGKTRLSIAAASALDDAFSDGIVFVDLATLTNPALVPTAIAQALGSKDPHGLGPEEALRLHLIDKQLLLLLDNFEHVLDAALTVSRILRVAPAVKVLATSREPLRLSGECAFSVVPLALPEPAIAHDVAALGNCESVTLFVARARDAHLEFSLTAENAEAVAEICRRLDGLPLALELAAARIRVVSPHVLAERLSESLPLLMDGKRDAPARHRTLREAIAWSYRLLNGAEQRLFCSLGCFVGGWTLGAAEAIADPIRDQNVFGILSSLVEKNLVRLDHDVGESRYAMLETIREFALEQLAAAGEQEAVRDRHADWCIALGEEAEPALEGFGGTQVAWLVRLDREIGNIRTALAWLAQKGDASRLLRLVAVLDTFWWLRPPYHTEVERWLDMGLSAAELPPSIRTAALYVAMGIAHYRGDWPKTRALAEESLAAAEAWGESFTIGRAQFNLGSFLIESGDVSAATALLSQALSRFRETRAASWVYLALSELGSALQLCGDLDGAVSLLDEALVLVRHDEAPDPLALQDSYGLSEVLGRRAYVARDAGDLVLATQLFSEELAIAQQLGSPMEILGALGGLAGIALDRGQPERAARLLGAIDGEREANGLARIAHALFAKQVEEATYRVLGEAVFNLHWHEGRAIPLGQAIADALSRVIDVLNVDALALPNLRKARP